MRFLAKAAARLAPALLAVATLALPAASEAAILYLEDFEGGSPDVSITPRKAPPSPFHDVVQESAFDSILTGAVNGVLGMEGHHGVDAVVSAVLPGSAPITTAGYTNLVLSLAIAASAGGSWESSDFLEIYIAPDRGVEILLDSFRINGANNLASGGGAGVELGPLLRTFLYPLAFVADELSIRIVGRPTSHTEQIAIDDVLLTGDLIPPGGGPIDAETPEPATIALMLAGLLAFGLARRRRR